MSRYLGSTQDVSNPVLAKPVVQSEPLLDCPSSALRILILNLLLFSAIKNQAERRKEKMATLARICRRLPRAFSTTLPGRAFSAQAAQSAENPTPPAPVIRESPDRVKWDYRGQRKIIPLGQWAPKIAVDAYVAPNVVLAGRWWYTTALPCGMAPFCVVTLTRLQLGFVRMYRNGVLSTPLGLLLQVRFFIPSVILCALMVVPLVFAFWYY
ncbi:UNVERIFIED_CONTAM: Gamma carbonic anhydrase-like 2, mitochondrial [Sesamum radiatum]|uniref:Gamma carbonic anhydrase-like 2, mitochondrial n=1 Tax=Sesamum radiatum TaxID=300843 RepID=A0AAW2WJ72_SESRA